jgi:hypothetical protein
VATWAELGSSGRSVTSTQNATDSAPTLDTEGCNLSDVGGFDLFVECQNAQTFTGTTGSFQAYKWSENLAAWYRAPELDVSIPTGGVGQRRVVFPGWNVSAPRGRVAHIANSVAVSGGTLTVSYICSTIYAARS